MTNTLALSAVAQFAQATARPVPTPDALRAALRELENAAFNLGACIDTSMDRYSDARAVVHTLLGLSLEDLT